MSATKSRVVRAWFGSHPIAEAHTDALQATHVADLMNRRFAGLRITNEPDTQPIAKEATNR
jgi:hypothetical protein